MAADPQQVAQLLQATSDPRHLKQAEAALKLEETKPGFSLLLLNIVASESLPLTTRISGALYFKNFIRFNYVDEEGSYKLPQNEVGTIKQELIGLMISVPPSLQSQLGEAISLIADSDFWTRWDTLVDDLVSRLTPDNAKVNNGVLEVAHSIFRRWRPLFRSDDLYIEINHVLNKFQGPFLELLRTTDAQIEANKGNKNVLQQHMTTMDLLINLFYDLSCQDLPPLFEESLQQIAALFSKYLTYENPLLNTDDESEIGVLERVRTGICEALVLYVQKFEDAFGPYVQPFITTIWNLLTTIGPETKYDHLVSKGLHFLTAVSGIKEYAQAFNDESVLEQIVEKAILPSVRLRESDLEQFEDSPNEYIRSTLEGTDIDTRRRAATEFLRTLLRQFEVLVTKTVEKYITYYLQKFAQNPQDEWQSKNAAVYLFTAIAALGTVTTSQGVLTVNPHLNVVDFFQNNIANDLVDNSSAHPILKVDAISYLYTFRSQLTKEQWRGAFQPLIQNLLSSNYVVYTYASIAVERVLSLTDASGSHVFGKEDVQPFAKDLLAHLFQLIEKEPAPEKIQDNEFLMRCVMRVLIVIKEGIVPITDLVLEHLIQTTKIISANPSNPRFYYYHFEAMGALIKYAAPVQPEKLEIALYSPFAVILQQDIEEFKPYVFQLFAALLEANPSGSLPDYYKALIGPVLMPDLWVSRGNVPALSRLLCSIIPRATSDIKANGQIEAILGIFQNLVSKSTKSKLEIYAFDILETVVQAFTGNDLAKYFPVILQLIYGRMNDSTPDYFRLRVVRFYHLVSALDEPERGYGTDYFIAASDSISEGAFVPLYLKVILPTTQQFTKPLDRKLAAISLLKTLTSSQKFAIRYQKGWGLTLEAAVKLVVVAPVIVNDTVVVVEQDVDDSAFGVGFTQLATCRRQPHDPYPSITEVKPWIKSYFAAANAKADSKLLIWLKERSPNPAVAQEFVSYLGL